MASLVIGKRYRIYDSHETAIGTYTGTECGLLWGIKGTAYCFTVDREDDEDGERWGYSEKSLPRVEAID